VVAPDGGEIWVTTEAAGMVAVVAAATRQRTQTIGFAPPGAKPGDIRPVGLAIAEDGKRAYVALSRAETVAVVDVATHRAVAYWSAGKRPVNVAVSRDGARLFVANAESDTVSVLDTASGKAVATIAVGRAPHSIVVDD
jgi:YVTN family beta-propeller protein